jgi:hypothetical protein
MERGGVDRCCAAVQGGLTALDDDMAELDRCLQGITEVLQKVRSTRVATAFVSLLGVRSACVSVVDVAVRESSQTRTDIGNDDAAHARVVAELGARWTV